MKRCGDCDKALAVPEGVRVVVWAVVDGKAICGACTELRRGYTA